MLTNTYLGVILQTDETNKPTLPAPNDCYPRHTAMLELVVILGIWLPFEFKLLPDIPVPYAPNRQVSLTIVIPLFLLSIYLLTFRQQLKSILSFRLSYGDLKIVVLSLLSCMVLLVSLGLNTNFLQTKALSFKPGLIILMWLVFFIKALPEELLFRGIIQQKLSHLFNYKYIDLLLASGIFGLAHLNNPTTTVDTPNWPFAVFAFIAGIFFGYVWLKTKKVAAAAIVHGTLNWLGWTFFII